MFKTRLLSGIVLVSASACADHYRRECSADIDSWLFHCIGMFELYRIFHIEHKMAVGIHWIIWQRPCYSIAI